MDFRFRGKSGRAADINAMTDFKTQLGHSTLFQRSNPREREARFFAVGPISAVLPPKGQYVLVCLS
jgi:hypothetical protein